MSNEDGFVAADINEYIAAMSPAEDPDREGLRLATADLPGATMQISPSQGRLMALLTRLLGARRAIEVGVYTGYSALCVAQALPDDGLLVACEISDEHADLAGHFWEAAGVGHKIDLRIAPALDTLDSLLESGEEGTFDLVFIDGDKENYAGYYERLLRLLRPGGLMMIDNVLWGGRVTDPALQDSETAAIRSLNEGLRDDDRVEISLLPISDGLMLARKRER
jgi:predicted O-methyltransferase YrrM